MMATTLWMWSAAAVAGTPSASQEAMYRALSARDPAPSCAEVEALSETPVADLVYVVEHATQPPWAGMRAASCLVERHAEEARDEILAWVGDAGKRGLAILVFDKVDALPEGLALEVARSGLAGPLAEDARTRLARAERAEVRALAERPVEEDAGEAAKP